MILLETIEMLSDSEKNHSQTLLMSNMLNVVKLLMVMPATNASLEQSFSTINL